MSVNANILLGVATNIAQSGFMLNRLLGVIMVTISIEHDSLSGYCLRYLLEPAVSMMTPGNVFTPSRESKGDTFVPEIRAGPLLHPSTPRTGLAINMNHKHVQK